MGLFNKLFGPPSPDKFAQLVIARLRQAGVTEALHYNAADFSIDAERDARHFLGNVYADYCRVDRADRDRVLDNALRAWAATNIGIPDEFEDARPDLMPMIRSRCYLELGLKAVQNPDKPFEVPHQIIGEHLCAILAYDLPTSMATINDEQLEKWGVTFYEAMEVARQNLEETTKVVAQAGSLYIVTHGDSYDSSRLLLTDRIRKLDFNGDIIALVPNRDSLFLAGSDDPEALAIMAELAKEPLEGPRSITGVALRLVDDEWEPWLPPVGHPSHAAFRLMQVQTMGQDYAQQQEILEKQQQTRGEDRFIAIFGGLQNEKNGEITTYCVWTDGIHSLLPRTDTIAFMRMDAKGQGELAARGTWEQVEREVGHLMTPQDLYPPRWLVESFPTADELARIGIAP